MLLKLFLVSALLFAFCDGKTLKLTDEMIRGLAPESDFASKAIRQLSSKQQSEYLTFFMERFEKMTSPSANYENEEKKFMEELKVAHPDIHKKIDAADKEYKQTLAGMSQPAQDFFEFYKNHKRSILKKLSNFDLEESLESLATVLCESLEKWNALNTETKNEVNGKFSKFHNTFESQQFQSIDCQPSVSSASKPRLTVDLEEEDIEFA